MSYKLRGRTRTATVATLTQNITRTGRKSFTLMAIGKGDLLDKLRRASKVRLTLELVFTDRDGNRTVRTRTIKLKR